MHYLSNKITLIAGVDEVGCGSLVGPVVSAAVILQPTKLIFGLVDSKKLHKNRLINIYNQIIQCSLSWSLGYADAIEIDQMNILQARLLAMKRSVDNLSMHPDLILVDGNQSPNFTGSMSYQCFIKGDMRVPIISAASIIAKVNRDNDMYLLDEQYPEYGFAKNKGYPTNFHLKQLSLYGPTKFHRKTFAPVRNILV